MPPDALVPARAAQSLPSCVSTIVTLRFLATRISAIVPVAMSIAALGVVVLAVASGSLHQPDEGLAAHVWQLMVAGQLPMVAWFAIRWLPMAPRIGLVVFGIQTIALVAALAPVYLLNL